MVKRSIQPTQSGVLGLCSRHILRGAAFRDNLVRSRSCSHEMGVLPEISFQCDRPGRVWEQREELLGLRSVSGLQYRDWLSLCRMSIEPRRNLMREQSRSPLVGLMLVIIALATSFFAYRHGQSIAWTFTFTVFAWIGAMLGSLVIMEASDGFVTNSTKTAIQTWTLLSFGAFFFLVYPAKLSEASVVLKFCYFHWLNIGLATLSAFAIITRYYAVWSAEFLRLDSDASPRPWSRGARVVCQLLLLGWFSLGVLIPQSPPILIALFEATGQTSTAAAARQAIESDH